MPDPQIFKATYSGVPVYEMITKGVALMRRRADGWLNATQILKVAGFDKPQRTRILERDVQKGEHEKVQGGYGKYQGTWVPLDRGLEIAQEYHIEDFIRPIVNFKPSAQSPPPAPKHITQPSAKRKARDDRSSMSTRSVRDSVRGDSSDEQDELNSDDDAVSNSLDASEPSRTPSPITAGRLAAPAMLRSPMPPVTRRLRQRRDDSIPEVTIAKPSNTPQDPIQRAYSEQILEYFISDSSQIPDLLLNPPADFDPNIAIDDDLHAPLHWACAMGRIRIVKLLISAGADIYRVNKLGQTALMRSVMFANNYDVRKFPELYELLHNVTLHIDIFNRTVFHHIIDLAMSKGKTHASRYYLETMLGRLSEYPKELADVINWRDEDGETALTMAARCRSKRICKLLIDHGANPKVTNNDGKSAEMYIIEDEKFRASPILGPRSVSALSFRVGEIVHAPNTGAAMALRPKLRKSEAAERAATKCVNEMAAMLESLANSFDAEIEEKEKSTDQAQHLLANIQTELTEHTRAITVLKRDTDGLDEAKVRLANLQARFASKMARGHRRGWERWIAEEERRDGAAREAGLLPGSSTQATETETAESGKRSREEDLSDVVKMHSMLPADADERRRACVELREEIMGARKRRKTVFGELVTLQAESGTGTKMAEYRALISHSLGGMPDDEIETLLPAILEQMTESEDAAPTWTAPRAVASVAG